MFYLQVQCSYLRLYSLLLSPILMVFIAPTMIFGLVISDSCFLLPIPPKRCLLLLSSVHWTPLQMSLSFMRFDNVCAFGDIPGLLFSSVHIVECLCFFSVQARGKNVALYGPGWQLQFAFSSFNQSLCCCWVCITSNHFWEWLSILHC